MKQFKSAGQAQRFLSAHDQINNLFHLRRDHVTAAEPRDAGARPLPVRRLAARSAQPAPPTLRDLRRRVSPQDHMEQRLPGNLALLL